MKVIKIKDARKKLAAMRQWTGVRSERENTPGEARQVRETIIHSLADYQRRRLVKIEEAFESRDRPA